MLTKKTSNPIWSDRSLAFLHHALDTFFVNDTIQETACESAGKCTVDQRAFKSILARAIGFGAYISKALRALLYLPIYQSAATAAADCQAASNGSCSFKLRT